MDEIFEARRTKLQAEVKEAVLALLDHMNYPEQVKIPVQGRVHVGFIVIAIEKT